MMLELIGSILLFASPGCWGVASPLVVTGSPLPMVSKACPCSSACVCGCNVGNPCHCNDTAPLPPAQPEKRGEPLNFGVKDDMRAKAPQYIRKGKGVSREEAFQVIEKDFKLTDDSKKYRITLIGTEAECKALKDRIKGTDLEKDCLLQSYRPDNWAVKDAGFQLVGSPVVYLQAPDGKVLHRQDDGEGAVEALRKARPDYKPEADPNGKPAPVIPSDLSKLPWYVWAIAAGALWLLLKPSDVPDNKK